MWPSLVLLSSCSDHFYSIQANGVSSVTKTTVRVTTHYLLMNSNNFFLKLNVLRGKRKYVFSRNLWQRWIPRSSCFSRLFPLNLTYWRLNIYQTDIRMNDTLSPSPVFIPRYHNSYSSLFYRLETCFKG
jgi:hypothetical protein